MSRKTALELERLAGLRLAGKQWAAERTALPAAKDALRAARGSWRARRRIQRRLSRRPDGCGMRAARPWKARNLSPRQHLF